MICGTIWYSMVCMSWCGTSWHVNVRYTVILHCMVLCAGQDYMADHNQQYLVEMDGNQAAGVLFKVRDVHSLFCFF